MSVELLQSTADPNRRNIVVWNPNSTRAKEVKQEVVDKADEHGVALTIPTIAGSRQNRIENLAEQFEPGDRVLVMTGDGTSGQVSQAAYEAQTNNHVDDLQLAFGPGGNRNDAAHTFGPRLSKEVWSLFNPDQAISEVYLLDTKVTRANNEVVQRMGLNYASLGTMARMVGRFNQQNERSFVEKSPAWFREMAVGVLAVDAYVRNASSKICLQKDEDDNFVVSDIFALNGKRICGYLKSAAEPYRTDKFILSELDLRMPYIVRYAPLLARMALRQTVELPNQKFVSRVSLRPAQRENVAFQVDGETEYYTNVESIEISKTPASIQVVTDNKIDL